jgi:hypothetical protein
MLVDVEIRERLSHYCMVTKRLKRRPQTLRCVRCLPRCEQDPTMKARMDRAASKDVACQNLTSNNFCVRKTRIEAHLDAHFRTRPEL